MALPDQTVGTRKSEYQLIKPWQLILKILPGQLGEKSHRENLLQVIGQT